MGKFSNLTVYVDESGDHGLSTIDPEYPVFVLAFCIFDQREYTNLVVPAAQRLKFEYFGHDNIILHSHEIRKSVNEFSVLRDAEFRKAFMRSLTALISEAPFTLVASVIDKVRLKRQYAYPSNPYSIAMTFCLERTFAHLRSKRQIDRPTVICVERRGKKEDDELELAFRRVVAGANRWGQLPFDIRFVNKQANSTGLQLADLVAYPIGRHILYPDTPYEPYSVVEPKFRRNPAGKVEGWGLKVFP